MMNAELNTTLRIPHSVFFLLNLGILLLAAGLLHKLPAFQRGDTKTFRYLHTRLQRSVGFFRFIWPLGTTPVAILLLLILYIPGWQIGLAATLAYLCAALSERGIKLKMQRPRPFESLPNVRMGQLKPPHDPSHPSGDSLRVWFLALIFPVAFGLSPWVYALSLGTAASLSLGRIALGVHYPLDVLGGAGLGILFAGLAILSYQLFTGLPSSIFSL